MGGCWKAKNLLLFLAGALFATGLTLGIIYLAEVDTKDHQTIGAVMLVVAILGPCVLVGFARDIKQCFVEEDAYGIGPTFR